MLALTGAGISASSGIPTYRDQQGRWQRSDPIQHQDFVNDPWTRQRYWCRSLVGWRFIEEAQPNTAHQVLNRLEERGYINLIVTQNVDRLHQRAGSLNTIDLHGRIDRVICLDCADGISREHMQQRLEQLNPQLMHYIAAVQPDGDADVSDDLVAEVEVPDCTRCQGRLSPDVVFFGGSVPRQRVSRVSRALEQANGLLVVGSSLQVFSGYRFCRMARDWGKPIVAINRGVTRADDMLALKLDMDCEEALLDIAQRLVI